MHRQKAIKEQLQSQLEDYLEKQKYIERRLSKLPKGTLRITHVRGNAAYYLIENGKCKYLKNSQHEFVQGLAERYYLEKLQKTLSTQIKTISGFIKNYSETSASDIFTALSQSRKELITPIFLPNEDYTEKWQNESYEGKGFAEGAPEFYSERGERVRSKSEKIIADKLFKMGIPYKYEAPLVLRRQLQIFPDFTVLNKRTREEFLWEHFGMMDNNDYLEGAFRKLDTYAKNNIFQGVNLILTQESARYPLNTRIVDRYIEHYLL